MGTLQDQLNAGYGFSGQSITLGGALQGGAVLPEPKIRIPLAMMNRHGLVAGATGTGKTKTLQLLTEQLSAAGVPVFVADIKGDLSGLAMPGEPSDRVNQRATDVGLGLDARRCTGGVRQPHRGTRGTAPRHRGELRPAAAGQGAGPQRDPDQCADHGLQVLRRCPAPAARFQRPARGAAVPDRRAKEKRP